MFIKHSLSSGHFGGRSGLAHTLTKKYTGAVLTSPFKISIHASNRVAVLSMANIMDYAVKMH